MARHKCIGFREMLTTLLPRSEIERLAQESGAAHCPTARIDVASRGAHPNRSRRLPVERVESGPAWGQFYANQPVNRSRMGQSVVPVSSGE